MVTPTTSPFWTVAVPVTPLPPPPLKVTVGVELKPLPPAVTTALLTLPVGLMSKTRFM